MKNEEKRNKDSKNKSLENESSDKIKINIIDDKA